MITIILSKNIHQEEFAYGCFAAVIEQAYEFINA
jgi:hypothetical protein